MFKYERGQYSFRPYNINLGTLHKAVDILNSAAVPEEGMFVDTEGNIQKFDLVNKPEHYNLNPYGIEAIDAIKAATCDAKGEEAVFQANIIKYIWRYRRKNGLEDLKKGKWYLEKLIELYETGRYKNSEYK